MQITARSSSHATDYPSIGRFLVKEAIIRKIRAVLAEFPQVEKAVLYGSRAKGDYKNSSDIDLTLCDGADFTLGV